MGRTDSEGFLYITGRIKELIITAGGENIAPVIIEDNIKTFTNVINNIMVVGEG
jgi:long-chain-fatty-acid--CoA ligase ACSBG